jgi:HD superfamily phosphohydrolase
MSATEAKGLINLAMVCALIHDVGHPPLGHTLDRFFAAKLQEGNEIADKRFLPRTITKLQAHIEAVEGVHVDDVQRVFSESKDELTGWGHFVSALISSELDVDRLDYLQRDAHFTGQHEGLLNVPRLLHGIRPFEHNGGVYLTFDASVLSDVEQFVYAREVMYLRCYERSEKVVSEWMILRAVNQLFARHPELETEIDSLRMLSDAQLLEIVEHSSSDSAKEFFRRVYRSDARNYVEVASVPFEANALKSDLHGLQLAFTKRKTNVLEKVETHVSDIAQQARIDPADVMMILPDMRLSDERKIGLDIWLLHERDNGGFSTARLLSEDDDESGRK